VASLFSLVITWALGVGCSMRSLNNSHHTALTVYLSFVCFILIFGALFTNFLFFPFCIMIKSIFPPNDVIEVALVYKASYFVIQSYKARTEFYWIYFTLMYPIE